MNVNVKEAFLEVFSRFKDYEFIWKFTGPKNYTDEIFNKYKNVHLFTWIDQTSILSEFINMPR
jgi:hypothetical protein